MDAGSLARGCAPHQRSPTSFHKATIHAKHRRRPPLEPSPPADPEDGGHEAHHVEAAVVDDEALQAVRVPADGCAACSRFLEMGIQSFQRSLRRRRTATPRTPRMRRRLLRPPAPAMIGAGDVGAQVQPGPDLRAPDCCGTLVGDDVVHHRRLAVRRDGHGFELVGRRHHRLGDRGRVALIGGPAPLTPTIAPTLSSACSAFVGQVAR